MLKGKGNPLSQNGEYTLFMVYKDKKPVGRVMVAIDEELNRVRGFKQGFFSMFECIDDENAAKALLDAAGAWLLKKGMDRMIGPLSPCNGDDRKGFVIMGNDGPPVLLNAYTKSYYPRLVEKYGFEKNDDHYAYIFDPKEFDIEKHARAVEYAKKKGGFRVDKLNVKDIENEARDIHRILQNSVPEEWDYLVTPSLEAVVSEFKPAAFLRRPLLLYRAQGRYPHRFMVALPDYNQVLRHMNGKILPIGWLKYCIISAKSKARAALCRWWTGTTSTWASLRDVFRSLQGLAEN